MYIIRSVIFNLDYKIDTLHFISNGNNLFPKTSGQQNKQGEDFTFLQLDLQVGNIFGLRTLVKRDYRKS
jgi:hypothetical protein